MKTKIRMLFFFLFFLVIQITNAKNIYVNDAALTGDVYCTAIGNDSNSGLSAALPKLTLTAALGIAVNGDVIYVDAGTWTGTTNTIDKELTIIGAGTGKTIFQGNASGSGGGGNVRFANINANNVTIKNMRIQWHAPSSAGARIFEISGRTGIVIENILIKSNRGVASGINPNINISTSSNVTIKGLLFSCAGDGADAGGAINVNASTLNLSNSIFKNAENFANNGGAINITGTSTVNIVSCNFNNCIAKRGGAISINGGTTSITKSCFSYNKNNATGPSSSEGGGAIHVTAGTNTIENCTFSNNCSGDNVSCSNNSTIRGGAILILGGTSTFRTCTFENNQGGRGTDLNIRVGGTLNIDNVRFKSVYPGTATQPTGVNLNIEAGTVTWKDSGTPTANGSGVSESKPEVSGTITTTTNTNNPSTTAITECINEGGIAVCGAVISCGTETVAPVILKCVDNKTVACGTTLADYRSEVSAYDDCSFTVSQSPAAGSALSGTTTVTMTVTDQKGNFTTCAFTVTVNSSTWNGTAWSNGTPTAETAVTFTGNFSSSADLAACSVLVTNNAAVVINSGHNYTVQNAVTVDTGSTFTFNNNANLVQVNNVSNTGNIIMKRNTNLLKRLDYTIWSAPVAGQNLLAFSPLTLTNRFYIYNTTTDLYNTVPPSSTSFATGIGYQIRVPNDHPLTTPTIWTGTFTGVPNNGPYNVTLATTGNKYNMVGNPYPSPINLTTFNSANTANFTGTIWFWRKENSTTTTAVWSTWNGGTFVFASDPGATGLTLVNDNVARNGQGFLIKGTSNTLSFTNAMRVTNTSNQFFRTDASDLNRIWLNLTNASGYFSQQAIRYSEGGTNDMDRMDAENINSSDVLFTSLRSNLATETNKFTIQSRQYPFDVNDVVPLSVKVSTAGTYSIEIHQKDGLFQDGTQAIYLKDNLTNTETNLNNGSYSFVSDAGVFDARFELKYVASALSNNQNNFENNVIVYQQNEIIHVNSSKEPIQNVKIFDIRGRLVHTADNINATSTNVKLHIENQVVLMRITLTNGAVITRKILN